MTATDPPTDPPADRPGPTADGAGDGDTRPAPASATAALPLDPRWGAFVLVCLAYLGVTVGEQVLSPVLPGASADLGFDEGDAGIAFGLLAGAIAVGNLVGGGLLGRLGPRRLMLLALTSTTAGSVIAALAPGFGTLVIGQLFLGAGAGLYFPAGLRAVPLVAGTRRKGFAMGLYGVAFSGGLTVAALLGTLGAATDWRVSFWVSAALGVIALGGTAVLPVHAESVRTPFRFPLQAVIGLPTFIGSVGAVCQYGAVPFLTIFAVNEWGLSAGAAALVLTAGRIISILAKIVSGAGMDRVGPIVSARRTGALLAITGLAWVFLPGNPLTYAAAAIFAGTISSLFPIANLVAVELFGASGPALGAYRSAQIGIGAAAGALVGLVGAVVGLRPTLAVAVATPALLLLLRARHHTPPPT
jgi:DHA1 family inner membrane transport protein